MDTKLTTWWAFDRVHNSRRPLDRLFALCDMWFWLLTFRYNIHWWARYRDGLIRVPSLAILVSAVWFYRVDKHTHTYRENHRITHAHTPLIGLLTRPSSAWPVKTTHYYTLLHQKSSYKDADTDVTNVCINSECLQCYRCLHSIVRMPPPLLSLLNGVILDLSGDGLDGNEGEDP